ncbi:unnamed protein product [Linum tenue]|uniref:Uncharacterized protein n=1 Tax=Linum tenue TaxID=586396 RepID=A0AAV0K421_9ROSI|nr:unnamed protein product [Linum tenue]
MMLFFVLLSSFFYLLRSFSPLFSVSSCHSKGAGLKEEFGEGSCFLLRCVVQQP